MQKITIKFTGDDDEETKEAFCDYLRDLEILSGFKKYCRDNNKAFNTPEVTKFEGNLIEISS